MTFCFVNSPSCGFLLRTPFTSRGQSIAQGTFLNKHHCNFSRSYLLFSKMAFTIYYKHGQMRARLCPTAPFVVPQQVRILTIETTYLARLFERNSKVTRYSYRKSNETNRRYARLFRMRYCSSSRPISRLKTDSVLDLLANPYSVVFVSLPTSTLSQPVAMRTLTYLIVHISRTYSSA